MEVKSISDCLNICDIAIDNDIDMSSLEKIQKYMVDKGMSDFQDENDARRCVMKQINLIMENLYELFEKEQKLRFIELRKLIIMWVKEIARNRDVDNEKMIKNDSQE